VSKSRRLRRLVPDQALYDRRVAGESLRALAPDYGVEHSTLSDFFRHRPEARVGLQEAGRRLEAEHKARQAAERRLKQKVQKRAREDKEHDRRLAEWPPPGEPLRSGYAGWLDEHDAPPGVTSRAGFSPNDDKAEKVVAAGGGLEQIIDATDLRTRENVLRNVDTQVMQRALANDAKFPWNARLDTRGLRKLVTDRELIRRRAAAEPLRSIASDYGVSHTTLSRYFKRPTVAKQLPRVHQRDHRRRSPRPR
jgi:hypothetical protein